MPASHYMKKGRIPFIKRAEKELEKCRSVNKDKQSRVDERGFYFLSLEIEESRLVLAQKLT